MIGTIRVGPVPANRILCGLKAPDQASGVGSAATKAPDYVTVYASLSAFLWSKAAGTPQNIQSALVVRRDARLAGRAPPDELDHRCGEIADWLKTLIRVRRALCR